MNPTINPKVIWVVLPTYEGQQVLWDRLIETRIKDNFSQLPRYMRLLFEQKAIDSTKQFVHNTDLIGLQETIELPIITCYDPRVSVKVILLLGAKHASEVLLHLHRTNQ